MYHLSSIRSSTYFLEKQFTKVSFLSLLATWLFVAPSLSLDHPFTHTTVGLDTCGIVLQLQRLN